MQDTLTGKLQVSCHLRLSVSGRVPVLAADRARNGAYKPGFALAGSGYRRCDDELGSRVERNLRRPADDEVGAFPGALAGLEGDLFGHPFAVVLFRRQSVGPSHAGEVAALGFPFIGLNPDGRVDQVRAFPPGRTDAVDDQQRAFQRHLDRALSLPLVPGRRPAVLRGPGLPRYWLARGRRLDDRHADAEAPEQGSGQLPAIPRGRPSAAWLVSFVAAGRVMALRSVPVPGRLSRRTFERL